ncbi:MAG TPA: HAMP domain-containing sensor histidine kinase [Gaiellaceae bacterium]|nr:HAMP domain-containing sensor histidine kinase [Gaiellaceae bacterium]
MRRFSGVGARLGLALLLVLAGALVLVYLIVVPSLENRLISSRISQLQRAAAGVARDLPADRFRWPDFLESESESANARVVVYDYVSPPAALVVVGDSRGVGSTDIQRDRVALRAALTLKPASGSVSHAGGRYAEAAAPVPGTNSVLLLSASLHDALTSVSLVRNRLVLAGILALIAAVAVGYVGAFLFARRLRRLESAAERIAAGQFDEPILDTSADEVGELARTFDRMRERLAALDHARREFIANASHELRTPLFSLGGFLELLTDEDLDEETRREFLGTMREQVDRLAKLATELLDLSRADAGQLRVEREEVDLAEIAESVVEEFAALALSGDHPLDAVTDGVSPVIGDEQRVAQIGRALVENALVHTQPGTRVLVRVGPGALSVEDDGPGIPAEHAGSVFERFYRLEGRRSSGSGLGLAIARELAQAMGGALELDSSGGRTVFTLRLPIAQPAEARAAAPAMS